MAKISKITYPLILIIIPGLYYLWKLAPQDSKNWHTVFGLFESGSFQDVQYLTWLLVVKVQLFLYLFLWYLSVKFWWKPLILFPISIELLKLYFLIRSDTGYFDDGEYLFVLPVIVPIIIFLIYLINKVFLAYQVENIKVSIDREIEIIINKISKSNNDELWLLKGYFEQLKEFKGDISEEKYLLHLEELKNKLKLIKTYP